MPASIAYIKYNLDNDTYGHSSHDIIIKLSSFKCGNEFGLKAEKFAKNKVKWLRSQTTLHCVDHR